MADELEFTAEADARVTDALRARFAAPRDDAYWSGLEQRVLARIAANARGSWLQVAAAWARPGLAAAAVLLVASALFLSNLSATSATDGEEVTFAGLTQTEQSRPEFIYTEYDAASQREETLRLVVAHGGR